MTEQLYSIRKVNDKGVIVGRELARGDSEVARVRAQMRASFPASSSWTTRVDAVRG